MNDGLGKDLINTIGNSEIPEAIVEIADGAIDLVSNSEIVDDLPIVGPLMKLTKSGFKAREYFFIKRLCKFLAECRLDEEEKAAFQEKIREMEDGNLGEKVFVAIEKCDDSQASGKIGRLFKAYVMGEINIEEFQRLTKAIQTIIEPDFEKLVLPPYAIQYAPIHVTDNLHAAGLLELMAVYMNANGSDSNHNKYKVSKLGVKYMRIAEQKTIQYISESGDAFTAKYLRNQNG